MSLVNGIPLKQSQGKVLNEYKTHCSRSIFKQRRLTGLCNCEKLSAFTIDQQVRTVFLSNGNYVQRKISKFIWPPVSIPFSDSMYVRKACKSVLINLEKHENRNFCQKSKYSKSIAGDVVIHRQRLKLYKMHSSLYV